MPMLLIPVRWIPVLVLAASTSWPLTLSAAPVMIDFENYVVSVGTRSNYFVGKLLTAGDLSGDQEYQLGTKRLLGDPAQVLGEATLTLDDLFSAAGRGDVRVSFDCPGANCVELLHPVDSQDPHRYDMIFLNPLEGTWFGQLYVRGVQGLADGVYVVRAGSFDQFVSVDEPASTALVGLALVGLLAMRRGRTQGPVLPRGLDPPLQRLADVRESAAPQVDEVPHGTGLRPGRQSVTPQRMIGEPPCPLPRLKS